MSEGAGLARFAVKLYGRTGVADACLLLQESAGVDVDVLLMAIWTAAQRGRRLDDAHIRDVHAHVADWNEQVVRPLRSMRQQLKHFELPALSDRVKHLRADIQKLELDAEMIELDALEAAAIDIGVDGGHGTATETAVQNGLAILSFYSGRAARDDERQALLRIAHSATGGDWGGEP